MTEKEGFPIGRVLTTYIIILLMYLYTYKQGSILLWAFFMIERLMSISYADAIDAFFESMEAESISNTQMVVVILFSILNVGIYLYTVFKYQKLFVILILGEGIDVLIKKVRNQKRED